MKFMSTVRGGWGCEGEGEGKGEGGFCFRVDLFSTLFYWDTATIFAFDINIFDILTFRHIHFRHL